VQLYADGERRTCEDDGVGAERPWDGERVLVLAVPGRVLEERLDSGRARGEGQEEAPAVGIGEGDVDGERERGEEVEQGEAEQLRLQQRGTPHAHPPHAPSSRGQALPGERVILVLRMNLLVG
jgi:hypothetical protein